jgi:hypothetical protein
VNGRPLHCSLARRRRPVLAICSWSITDDALGWIAIDQRTQIERMLHAANFVLDGMHNFATVRIDDVLESILMLIALLADQAPRSETAMRPRKVVDIDLDMVLIVGLKRPVGFPEKQILAGPDRDASEPPLLVLARTSAPLLQPPGR